MLPFLDRLRLKRLARAVAPDPGRRFDPIRALDGDLDQAAAAFARTLEARRAVVEAARCGTWDGWLLERLVGRVIPSEEWAALVAAHAYQPSGIAAQQQAWGANPGADLVPQAGGPHAFGGDTWRTPACRGCGHPIRAWFTLDLEAIPALRALLPGWRWFPLLGCVDCMVFAGGEDDAEDPPDAPQVGGVPAWTQDAVRVYCPSCRNEMAFVASMANPVGFTPQIAVNNESGFQYHFACAACRRLSVVAQWT
jgi:hypothetical protein